MLYFNFKHQDKIIKLPTCIKRRGDGRYSIRVYRKDFKEYVVWCTYKNYKDAKDYYSIFKTQGGMPIFYTDIWNKLTKKINEGNDKALYLKGFIKTG